MSIDQRKVKLFSLRANRPLAEEISKACGIPLSEVEVSQFADGEITTNVDVSVRGHHVFIVQPTAKPANDSIMELLILADAMKRASCASISVIMPYYGYSRQDRKARSRQPISAKMVANLYQISGINRIICMDLHAAQIQGFFDIPIDNFPAAPSLASYIKRKRLENIVVVSPDHGGVTRARSFARILNAPLAIIDKRRPAPNKAEVMNIIGDVNGKVAILIDDIIDTGGTLIAAANALKEDGAIDVYACATHGVFSDGATDDLQNSIIKEVVVTNTINLPPERKRPKIKQLNMGPLLGEALLHILNDEPISNIFDRISDTQ